MNHPPRAFYALFGIDRGDYRSASHEGPHRVDALIDTLPPRFARSAFDSGVVINGSEGTNVALENELATGSLSVGEARDRVSSAAEKLREGG